MHWVRPSFVDEQDIDRAPAGALGRERAGTTARPAITKRSDDKEVGTDSLDRFDHCIEGMPNHRMDFNLGFAKGILHGFLQLILSFVNHLLVEFLPRERERGCDLAQASRVHDIDHMELRPRIGGQPASLTKSLQ